MKQAVSLAGFALIALLAACRPHQALNESDAGRKSQGMWERVGRALAAELGAAGVQQGSVLLVRSSATALVAQDHDAIEASFRAAGGGLEVVTVRVPDLPRPPGMDESFPVLARPLDLEWVSKEVTVRTSVVAVVSLVGAPVRPQPKLQAPLICYAPEAGEELKGLLRDGVVRAAVAAARHVPPGETDWFKIRFTVLRRDQVDTW